MIIILVNIIFYTLQTIIAVYILIQTIQIQYTEIFNTLNFLYHFFEPKAKLHFAIE